MSRVSGGALLERDRDSWLRIPYEDRLMIVREALQRLQQSIADECPGPHEFVQHPGLRPPYCEVCGFTDVGLPLGDTGAGKGNWEHAKWTRRADGRRSG